MYEYAGITGYKPDTEGYSFEDIYSGPASGRSNSKEEN